MNKPDDELGQNFRAQLAKVTGGLAPEDYASAFNDWWSALAADPKRQAELAQSGAQKLLDFWKFAIEAAKGDTAAPPAGSKQFAHPSWNHWPFNVLALGHTQFSEWAREALGKPGDLPPETAQRLEFALRHVLDSTSPAHYLHTNPELLAVTAQESGANLARGLRAFLEDAQRQADGKPPAGTEAFRVGEQVGITPGKVVLRNELIELIQYAPQTPAVYAEPILIVPAWIMKYYILDLSPHNSLVRYLVSQGHTVFMISWKNPHPEDRALGMDDYVRLGFEAALAGVSAIVPGRGVHAVGYCIGGTLLSIGAARLSGRGAAALRSMTLLAAQTDFSEPGELSVFITPAQLAMLEAIMQEQGVLSSDRMGAAFALLRSSDLIWAPAIKKYVRGEKESMIDLMAWNADGTRMPARMHSEYLARLYLRNELAQGQFSVAGQRVDLATLRLPMFVLGTETDHVAPWRSVYKARGLTRSEDYTFALTSGGHNAGIVSGPQNPKRRHRILHWHGGEAALTPEQYMESAELHTGSWWPTWQRWLAEHSARQQVEAPPMGNAGAGYPAGVDAPGEYVRG
ncbi:MAG: alpha/beta fold hydrolase [Gammaproteobacteria bacterium]|nr:alpha/beta fold hydrolase [Gammaproteobacteria bacterium]